MSRYSGVYAALLVPRTAVGELDVEGFRRQVAMLARQPLTGFAINGATGEFTFSTPGELQQMVEATRELAGDAQILAGVGAGDVRGAALRARIAKQAGANALLLPMPSFFPYRQDDLHAFCTAVADTVELPVLLYNLPQFTTGLNVETSLSLIAGHPNIIGIKDSSGSLDTLRALTQQKIEGARIIGNDSALCDALTEGVCDAVVSGVACALPELMTSIFGTNSEDERFSSYRDLLDEFIAQLDLLPTPWGLKMASEARGFTRASYPFPLSEARAEEVTALREWFQNWLHTASALKPLLSGLTN